MASDHFNFVIDKSGSENEAAASRSPHMAAVMSCMASVTSCMAPDEPIREVMASYDTNVMIDQFDSENDSTASRLRDIACNKPPEKPWVKPKCTAPPEPRVMASDNINTMINSGFDHLSSNDSATCGEARRGSCGGDGKEWVCSGSACHAPIGPFEEGGGSACGAPISKQAYASGWWARRAPICDVPIPPFNESSLDDAKSWIIYKVPLRLSEVNKSAYVPIVISIGPYHYNACHLKRMEGVKQSCFNKIVEGTTRDINEFVKAMKPFEKQVGECYEKPFGDIEIFYNAKNLVYDGCFIVQLIRGIYPEADFFKLECTRTDIRYDLLLLENQLPFSVLLKLYPMIVPNGELDDFVGSALSFFKTKGQGPEIWRLSESEQRRSPNKDIKAIKHLLDLVYSCCHPSQYHRDLKANAAAKAKAKAEAKQTEDQRSWNFIRNATELEEAGIKFSGEKVQDQEQDQVVASLFDIIFTEDTKVLKIPTLHVDDNTERIFRNLMAYEQFIPSQPTYVSDYVVFMDNLINTGKDVQLLCNKGIIDNWLGDDEAVAQMFNKLRDFIYSSKDFYYAEIFDMVNEHCQKKWNKWKATLKRDYFNSPWSLISVLAAVVLLLLTFLQTIFSVLSYFQW